jgi:hypothetical protein
MKTPTKPEDIKKGDLIRYEHAEDSVGAFTAVEFLAEFDGRGYLPKSLGGQHFLLDRPTPPVELPTEECLGWVESDGVAFLGLWDGGEYVDEVTGRLEQDTVHRDHVTAFTPAAAVPKSALDELRAGPRWMTVETFLAAVDAANGDDR